VPDVERRLQARTPLRELIDEAFGYPPVAAPGTRFEYSDYGMAIAARMAEVVSRQPFNQLVHERVIERGHLYETYMPRPQEIWSRIAHVRDVPAAGTHGAMYNSEYGRRLNHPAFGVFASARDLLRFGMLFWERSNKRILSRVTVRAMTRDQLGGGLPGRLVAHELAHPQPWGLGFMIRGSNLELGFGELASPSAFGHPGASGCLLLIDPENELSLAYLSNRHAASGFERFLHRNATVANAVLASLTN
jgi:CubicO group peptidase (beta-lactamase class C family)